MTVKNTNSDVRVAIKTLYCWAVEPDIPLKEHFEKAGRDIIFEVYKQISVRFNEEPFSYVHFYSNLSYLQSLGLILLVSTKVNRAYTNRLKLTFDPAILASVWQMRFG